MGILEWPNGKFGAQICIDGKQQWSPRFATREEAEAWLEEKKVLQKAAKAERRRASQAERHDVRERHVDHLEANMAKVGGNQAKDKLSRDLVKLAAKDHATLRVFSGVEYAPDLHIFRCADDLGFDALLDVELDDAVPTLVVELKLTQSLLPDHGKMDNPQVVFNRINYADREATIVLMMYVPERFKEASEEALKATTFWWKIAKGWTTANGDQKYSLRNARAENRGLPGVRLADVLAKELERRTRHGAGLLPYAERARLFRSNDHRVGQRAIDCLDDQVFRPIGARFVPCDSGAEGGPDDRVLVFSRDTGRHKAGERLTVQVKTVCLQPSNHQAGFHACMCRCNGSTSERKLYRPYHVSDGVDLFLYVALLPDETLGEYWAAYVPDLLGDHAADRIISDDSAPGVMSFWLHPALEDKARLRDVVPIKQGWEEMVQRTRGWLRKLGPILPPAEAAALKAEAAAARRALRLSAKAQAAAAAAQAAAAAASEAGPSYVTNNIHNDNSTHNHLHLHQPQLEVPPGKRRLISDFFGKK